MDQSLNMDLFYKDARHLIKEGNERLAKGIMTCYKELLFAVYNPNTFLLRTWYHFLIIPTTFRRYHQTKLPAN